MIQPTGPSALHTTGNDGSGRCWRDGQLADLLPIIWTGEAIVEDMLGHSCSHDEKDHDHDHEAELDERMDFPENAKLIVAQLTEALASLTRRTQTYRENDGVAELDALIWRLRPP